MLSQRKPAGDHVATCDKCRAVLELEIADVDAARRELGARGWMEAARKGRGRERWDWWCPRCAPSSAPAKTFGLTTAQMVPKGE